MHEHSRLTADGYRAILVCVSCGRVAYTKGFTGDRRWERPIAVVALNLPGILCRDCQPHIEARCPGCGRRKIDGIWEDRPVRFTNGSTLTLREERCPECPKETP